MEAQIVIPNFDGKHNADHEATVSRLHKAQTYQDLSTIIICPTRGSIPAKIVLSWMGMLKPMNQKIVGPIFSIGLEVAEAYNKMIEAILAHPEMSKFKYILTIEEDNSPPPDGLLKLYESIEGQVDGQKYDVVGGLYFTKGAMGQPMQYGNPKLFPRNFIPQKPVPDSVNPCNGLGMGFTLFRMSCFTRLEKPWFKTVNKFDPGKGCTVCTQDLYFFDKAAEKAFKCASDSRVKVGHYDQEGNYGPADTIW